MLRKYDIDDYPRCLRNRGLIMLFLVGYSYIWEHKETKVVSVDVLVYVGITPLTDMISSFIV